MLASFIDEMLATSKSMPLRIASSLNRFSKAVPIPRFVNSGEMK